MWLTVYARVEPYLLRDLFSRLPGKFLRVDGTYEIMKKTMNLNDAESPNNCLTVVMGEFGHIVSFAFSEAESDKVTQRLFYFIKKRIERVSNAAAVHDVVAEW